MHIVFDARSCTEHFPGIGRYVRSLIEAMVPLLGEDRLTILSCDGCVLPDVDVPVVTLAGSAFSLRALAMIPRKLRELEADVYHSPYLLAPLRPRVASVVTLHDLIPLTHPQWSSLKSRLIYRWWGRCVLSRYDRVIAVSRYAAGQGEKVAGVRHERIHVISHGVDPRFSAHRRRSDTSADAYLLYVGSDRPHKGLDLLLQAMAKEPSLPPVRIVGLQSDLPQRRKRVASLRLQDRVEWMGQLTETALSRCYGEAMALIIPSRAEGFGLPVLEAMAHGCPVIASDIPPLVELGGDAIETFRDGEVASLRVVLRRVVGDDRLRRTMHERGVARAAEYCWQRAAEMTLAAYREAVR